MWQALIAAYGQYSQNKAQKQGGGAAGMASGPMTNGGSAFDSSNWTVATGGSKATATALPEISPLMIAGVALGGLVIWKVMKKKG